jgi:hypothetical protein
MTIVKSAIPLDQAPEHFFDQKKWQSFLKFCKSRDDAICLLTSPGPRIINFYRYDPNSEDNRRRKLREEILKGFIVKLASGEIIAKGMQPPSTEIGPIPAPIWKHLSLNFNDNTACGGKYEFIGIQLFNAGELPIDIVTECVDWLRDQNHASLLKEDLRDLARDHFGKHLKTRDFNEAYKKVCGKGRGRPPKPKIISK